MCGSVYRGAWYSERVEKQECHITLLCSVLLFSKDINDHRRCLVLSAITQSSMQCILPFTLFTVM